MKETRYNLTKSTCFYVFNIKLKKTSCSLTKPTCFYYCFLHHYCLAINQPFLEQYPLHQGREFPWAVLADSSEHLQEWAGSSTPVPRCHCHSSSCIAPILKPASSWKPSKTHLKAPQLGLESGWQLPEAWKTQIFHFAFLKQK